MGFVSLSEDALERWLQDAFLQLNKAPSPHLIKAAVEALRPKFLEAYAEIHALKHDLQKCRAELESERDKRRQVEQDIACLREQAEKSGWIRQELEGRLSDANQAETCERLHVEQLRKRLATKEKAEAIAAQLRQRCAAYEERIGVLEQEAADLRKLTMQQLFGKDG